MGTNFKANGFKAGIAGKTGKRRKKLAVAVENDLLAASWLDNDLVKTTPVVMRTIASLKSASRRVRRSNAGQRQRIIRSMAAYGFIGVVLITGERIVDGHQRVEAAKALGIEEVPTMDVSHLPPDVIESLAIALNRIGETGEWDLEVTRELLIELDFKGLDLAPLGFDPPELDALMLDPVENDDDDALNQVPALQAGPPVSCLGDLYQLGKHRLYCGSALDTESYNILLDGQMVTVIFTDPPYNVKIKGNVSGLGKVKHDEFAMASGEQTKAEFFEFLATTLQRSAAHVMPRGVIFAFMDFRSFGLLHKAGESVGLTLINTAVWYKGNGGMGALYRSAHELVAVFCKGDSPLINNVKLGAKGRDRTNVWCYPGANQPGSSANKALASHPTPKDVRLVVDALLDVSNKGDAVLDPFLGSGTTIIAAEECGRVAYGIELEPKFVDCAIERWQQLTGEPAYLVETGETFAEVAARRAAEQAATIN